MSRVAAVLLATFVILPGPATGQAGANVHVGDKLRVWTPAQTAVTGRVTAADAAMLQLQPDGSAPQVTIPRATVTRIEISRAGSSKGHSALKGAIWGAAISGIAGAVLLGLQSEEVGDGSSVAKAAALGAFSGGLFGGLIGAGIGAARGGERWEPLWP